MTSPTQLTLRECKRRGWIAQVVEHRVPRVNILRDLFGVIDVVAIVAPRDDEPLPQSILDPPSRILAIQCCAGASHSARRAKILAEPRAASWVEAGGRLELWSWAKQGARGKRKTWQLRCETYAEMLASRNAKEAA